MEHRNTLASQVTSTWTLIIFAVVFKRCLHWVKYVGTGRCIFKIKAFEDFSGYLENIILHI